MSTSNDPNDAKVQALRDMGHDDAADDLAMLFEADAERAAQKQAAEEAKRKAGPPDIPLISDDPAWRQAETEGRLVAERLMNSGVGQSWGSAGSLLEGDR